MFQVSNPLRFYSNNPNIDDTPDTDGAYSAVPSLAESQQRLQRTNKITNYIIYGCATFLLAILVLTVGITIWKSYQGNIIIDDEGGDTDSNKETITITEDYTETIIIKRDDDTTIIETHDIKKETEITIELPHVRDPNLCAECLDYEEIIIFAKVNTKDAENYITNKVAESTTLDLDTKDDERIAAMETFVDRMAVIPRALAKVNDFLRLNQSFNVDLTQAADKEKNTHELRYQYEKKVQDIGNHTVKALTNIGETGDLRKQREKLEKELKDTEVTLNKRISDLEDQKYEVENAIAKFKAQLSQMLRDNDIPSEAELNSQASKKKELIITKQKETSFCDRKINTNTGEVSKLTIEIRRLTDLLENTKLQLTQYQWVSHILQTIAKFEDVRDQVKELQISQLADGKDSLNKLITSLTNKEEAYIDAVKNSNAPPEARTETTTVDEYGNVKRVISLSTVRDVDLAATLKLYVQREQELLRTWAREQFKTLKLSVNEIANLTTTIDNLRDRIRDHSAEYEKQARLVSAIETNRTTVSKAIEDLNEGITVCRDTIATAKSDIAGAQADLVRFSDLLTKLKAASGESAKKEARLSSLKGDIEKENQYLDALRKSLRERINKIDSDLRDLDEKLRGITAGLNVAITENPQPRDVEKYIGGYLEQIRKSNTEYKDLLALLEDISRIVC